MKLELLFFLISVSLALKVFNADKSSTTLSGKVKLGEAFKISLISNPTTGFRWELKSTPSLCQSSNATPFGDFAEPQSTLSGASGKQEFTFVPIRSGREHFIFVYEQPWNKDDSVTLEVNIEIS